ncbi:triose-phosphate isomerase [bacterium]|nr:triose-phosphate isomerase [bacterium]
MDLDENLNTDNETKKSEKQHILIGNWKMKLNHKETLDLTKRIKAKFKDFSGVTIVLSPNYISMLDVKKILKDSQIKLGAQNVFWEEKGAYTGEIPPGMLVEAGCEYVIIGHSERRKFLMENYEMIHREIKAVLAVEGLIPIVCIGENWDERKTDRRDFVLFDQMQQALSGIDIGSDQKVIIAYEPIWAIGSGTAIESSEAEYAHKIIKLTLNDMFGMEVVKNNFSIIYGGSINSNNVDPFVNLENLDGMLVGGASLDPEELYKVAQAILKK